MKKMLHMHQASPSELSCSRQVVLLNMPLAQAEKIILQRSFLCNNTIKHGDQCRPPREQCLPLHFPELSELLGDQHLPVRYVFCNRLFEDTCSVY